MSAFEVLLIVHMIVLGFHFICKNMSFGRTKGQEA